MEHDDDTRTSQEPGAGTDAEGSRGPGKMAPGGGMTVGSGELRHTKDKPSAPGEGTVGDIPAQDAASADALGADDES